MPHPIDNSPLFQTFSEKFIFFHKNICSIQKKSVTLPRYSFLYKKHNYLTPKDTRKHTMVHLTNTSRSATFLLGTAMLFFFCAPTLAQTPTFKSTSSYKIANPNYSAQQLDPTTIGHETYRSTIYTPFGSSTPSSNNNPGGNNDSGSGTDDDDVGIPGWADTPSEPLPMGDTAPLFLFAAAMIAMIAIRQRRKQKQLSTQTSNNHSNNDTNEMTLTQHTSKSLRRFLMLALLLCVVGEVSAEEKRVYFRPSTCCISGDNTSWAKMSTHAWFAMHRSPDNTIKNQQWHSLNTYTSKDIYNGNNSRFLAFTVYNSESSTFAFYRVGSKADGTRYEKHIWKNTVTNEEIIAGIKSQDTTLRVFNCIPNDKWWNDSEQWNTKRFDVEEFGNHNLVCIKEGQWSDYYFAYYIDNDIQLYFANIHNWTTPTFVRGKDIYSYQHSTTQIPNTKLYTTTLAGKTNIAYKDYAFIDNGNNGWGNDLPDLWKTYDGSSGASNKTTLTDVDHNRLSNRYNKATKYSGIMEDDYLSGINLFIPSENNNEALTKTPINSYEDLNHTLTIKNYIYNPQTKSFDNSNAGGYIEYFTHKLTGATTTQRIPEGNGYITIDALSGSTTAAYTGSTTLIAHPKDGYKFVGWYDKNGTLLHDKAEFTWYKVQNYDNEVHARFITTDYKHFKYRVQTCASGQKFNTDDFDATGGSITVTATDGQSVSISKSLGNDDRYHYLYHQNDTEITCTATANSGYVFVGWWNNGKGPYINNPLIDKAGNLNDILTARFTSTANVKAQTVNISGSGTVTINYQYSDNLTRSYTTTRNTTFYAWNNSTVTLTATTDHDDYVFDGWYNSAGNKVSSNTRYEYIASTANTLTAKFKCTNNKLTVSVLNYNPEYDKFEEYGYEYNTVTLTQGSTTVSSYSSLSQTFDEECIVTLTATPEDGEDGYDFVGWYIDNEKLTKAGSNSLYTLDSDDSKELKLNLSGAVAVNAHFAPKKCYKIELFNNLGGTYVVRYSKNQTFDQAVTKESSLDQSVYTYLPYGGVWMDVPITKPILGYEYKGYKIGGTFRDPDETVNYIHGANRFMAHFVRSEDQVVYLHLINYKGNIAKGWENATKENCTYYAFVENSFYYYSTPRRTTKWIKMEPIGDYCYRCTIPGGLYDRVNFVQAKETAPDINGNEELYVGYANNENQHKRSGFVRIPATRHNCYRLGGIYSSTNVNGADAWTTPPTTTGDYRLIYIEQEVASKTEINRTYEFIDGDRVKKIASGTKFDTVSLHIYNKVSKDNNGNLTGTALNNPEIILQQWDGTAWVDVERHMVFGPLKSDNPGVIRMPGCKNTAPVVDLGIDAIKAEKDDATQDYGSGVWNFVIEQDGNSARLLIDQTHRYTGDYYIRTPNADGQYNNFTHPGNILSYSEYAKNNSDYSHYFIRYVDIYEDGTPTAEAGKHPVVKFCVANDYAINLCKEFTNTQNRFKPEEDVYVLNAGDLPADATVRFGWDIKTNRLTRAYIANTTIKNNEYLVVEGEEGNNKIGSPSGDAVYFTDNSNWLYSIDLPDAKAGAKAKVKAKMNGQYQYFMGSGLQDGYETLISGNGTNTYPIRLLYDFKDDRFTTIYRPKSGTINNDVTLSTPLMIEREHNGKATQIVLNTNKITTVQAGEDQYTQPAYAVMTFQESVLADASKTHHEKMFYWISFPFDVRISDVFGLGDYGKYWIMEEYNGKQRAASGLAQNNWKYITKKSHILKKDTGYVLCLNYSQILQDQLFKSYGGSDKTLNSGKLSLYFPSYNMISSADITGGQTREVTLEQYENANTAWNHHNWHIIGVPSFADPKFVDLQDDIPFVYEYWHPGDAYAAVSINDVEFQAMHAYMVQYHGKINWESVVNTGDGSVTQKGLAAKTDEDADKNIMLRLELQQAGSTIDKTYVQLRNDKGTKGFDMSLDLTKIINAGANIYSIVDNHEMAGNAIPKEETVLPLGVVITAAGEYTFAMPNGTEGMIVELIDYEQGTSTNLLVGDYTVNMPVGTNNTRFALRLKPDKVATSVEDITSGTNDNNVRKLLIDGVLYLVKDGAVYDAQGHCVR